MAAKSKRSLLLLAILALLVLSACGQEAKDENADTKHQAVNAYLLYAIGNDKHADECFFMWQGERP